MAFPTSGFSINKSNKTMVKKISGAEILETKIGANQRFKSSYSLRAK